MVYFSL